MVAGLQGVSSANQICIVGVGACTSVGLNAPATAAAVRAGISGFQEHPFMINQEGDPYMLAMVPSVDASLGGAERYIAISTSAIHEALEPLKQLDQKKHKLRVMIALPENRPGLPDDLGEKITGHVMTLSNEDYAFQDIKTANKGHTGGLMALESASRLLAAGENEFCLVGGVDSYIDPDTLDWIEENEQLHIPSNAWGFIPGEAAGFCLVCSDRTAHKYRLPVKARLVAISTGFENNKIKTETICIGEGLTQAVRGVVAQLPENVKIDYTICDQNGEAYRADEFGFMLCRLSDYFIDPSDYMAPADCWGDVGAASFPLFLNQVIAAGEKRYAKGECTLLWGSSEGGERGAGLVWAGVREGRIG